MSGKNFYNTQPVKPSGQGDYPLMYATSSSFIGGYYADGGGLDGSQPPEAFTFNQTKPSAVYVAKDASGFHFHMKQAPERYNELRPSPRHRPSPSPQGVHSGRGGHGGRGALRKLRPSASMADEAARRVAQLEEQALQAPAPAAAPAPAPAPAPAEAPPASPAPGGASLSLSAQQLLTPRSGRASAQSARMYSAANARRRVRSTPVPLPPPGRAPDAPWTPPRTPPERPPYNHGRPHDDPERPPHDTRNDLRNDTPKWALN